MAIKFEDLKGTNRSARAIAGLEAMGSGTKIQGVPEPVRQEVQPEKPAGDPADVVTLTDGRKVTRSLGAEQGALGSFGKKYGYTPSTPKQWQKFHDEVYQNDISNDNDVDTTVTKQEDFIGSETIGDTADIKFNEVKDKGVTDVTKLDSEVPEMKLTPQEEKMSDFNEEIRGLIDKSLGETEFRAGLEKEAGLPGKVELMNDISSQLKILQNEAKAIPLRLDQRQISNSMIRKETSVALRENAIASLALASQMEVAKGNISTATMLIDRAVDAEFGGIKEEINAKMKNLDLLMKDPKTTIQEKNRAASMNAILNEQKKQTDRQEVERKAVYNMTLQAQQNGADAPLLKALGEAETQLEAMQIAGELLDETGGWEYVNTPAKRDALIAQGYEITQAGGRTYARLPKQADETVQAYVAQIRAGKIKPANVPSAIRDAVITALGTTPITPSSPKSPSTPKDTPEEKKFRSELVAEQKKLARGGDWGKSWNYLHNRYPEASNDELDAMLNKDKYYNN